MKLRAVLFGSAAILQSVTFAQAADAIVVEAEPMEYVKVCDMYGAGYFYIPGTETCLSVSGYVRSTYTHAMDKRGANDTDIGEGENNISSWNYRGRSNFNAKNETEFGTLGSDLRIQGGDDDAGGDANVAIDRAMLSLGGFNLGYGDTYYDTNHDYGAGSPAINDGFYDDDQAMMFDYTAVLMEGVAVTVGVQDSNGGSAGAAAPDFYAGFHASFGGLTLAGTAIRDSTIANDEWAYKGSGILALGESGWTVGGWYAVDDGGSQYVTGYFDNSIEKEWGVQVNRSVTGNLSVYGVYSEAHGNSPVGYVVYEDAELVQWATGMVWAPVDGLEVQVEYSVLDVQADLTGTGGAVTDSKADAVSVRVTRSF